MSSKIPLAVIGCGIIGELHISGYTDDPHAEVAAICDIDRLGLSSINNGALLSFDEAVRLESVRAGFATTDSDIFVMAFTGFGSVTATQSLDGGTFANLTSRGWTLIGNYANIGTATKDLGTAAGDIYSSFWLIGAGGYLANSGVNSGDIRNGSAVGFDKCSGTGKNQVCGKYDYLKLASVGGTIKPNNGGGNVPEPGSLALAGIALLGMVGMRRRKNAA